MSRRNKYGDKYIAMPSFNDQKVIAFGKDAVDVHARAKKIVESPVIVYVPRKGIVMM